MKPNLFVLGKTILSIAFSNKLNFLFLNLSLFKNVSQIQMNRCRLSSRGFYSVCTQLSVKNARFFVLALSLFYSHLALADAPTIEDIKSQVVAKIPPHLELKDLSFVSLKNVGNAIMPIYQGTLALETILREPLYALDGNENGTVRLIKVVDAGTPVSRSATVMATTVGATTSKFKAHVVFDFDRKDKKHFPLSSFRKGGYIIVSEKEPAATPSSPTVASNATPSVDDKAKAAPWEKTVPPENLLQLSHTLWDISTGKLIDTQWIADGVRPIPELPGLYWPNKNDENSGVPGFAPKLLAPHGLVPVKPIPEVSHGQLLTSTNHQQFVEIKQGDLWINDVNWKDNRVSSPKKLTDSGEYGRSQLIAWYGNEVYLYTRKPEDKPVVRVNTETGDMEKLPYFRALQGHHSSPDRRFRVHHGESDMMLHVYDFATHEAFTIDGFHAFRRQGVVSKDHKFGVAIEPEFWVSNTEFFNMSAWYDLEKREQNLITDWPEMVNKFPRNVSVRNVTLVPGGDFIDISIEGYGEFTNDRKQKGPIKQRYRINRQTDELIALPAMPSVGWNKDAVWVDSKRYLFYRSKGTPEKVGLWLYDIPSQQSTLLSDLVPNHRFRAQNVQSANLERIEGFKPAFKTSPF